MDCDVQVYYGMNLLQQFIIRRVGASLFAMGTALRLVASVAGKQHTLHISYHASAHSQGFPWPCEGVMLQSGTPSSCSVAGA